MRILNFGSMNLDYVYSVDHIVQPGETISSDHFALYAGGKGLNQSVALARAGAEVFHAGMVGPDGGMLLEICRKNGVDTTLIRTVETRTGNAMIQVSRAGQNSIVLYGGANLETSETHIGAALSHFGEEDLLLLQNEISLLDRLIERAAERGIRIALNPSPFNRAMERCDLSKIGYFLLNEVEAGQITGETDPDAALRVMAERYPEAVVVLTLGKQGVVMQAGGVRYRHGIYDVPVVDTTAAGDTFTGYFLSGVVRGDPPEDALRAASVASSLAVSRAGAIPSIPWRREVEEAELQPVILS